MNRDLLIYFDQDWLHQKYYGWELLHADEEQVVLGKKVGFLHRFFVLTRQFDPDLIAGLIRELRVPLSRVNIVIHDFSGAVNGTQPLLGLLPVRSCEATLLLYDKTIIIDLTRPLKNLWEALSPDYRRKCRKAEAQGIRASRVTHDLEAVIRRFHADYVSFCRSRGLAPPPLSVLPAMQRGANLRVYDCRDPTGTLLGQVLVYVTSRHALFLYGMNYRQANDGAGQFLHWMIIKDLHAHSFAAYDLCGFPRDDEILHQGIYRFKRGFCRTVTDLGQEWHYRGTLYRLVAEGMYHLKADYQRLRGRPA